MIIIITGYAINAPHRDVMCPTRSEHTCTNTMYPRKGKASALGYMLSAESVTFEVVERLGEKPVNVRESVE